MKAEKKPKRIKHKIREEKKRQQHIVFTLAILIAVISISGFIVNSMLNQSINQVYQFKAAIVDHLSLTQPNQTFIETSTNTLEQAGYTVDYYPNENVTVEFYRNLATYGYGLIILRVHSTTGGYPAVVFFTSERYSTSKYMQEQLTDRVVPVAYSEEERDRGEGYFGITQSFVTSSIKGRFANTIVVMMGCESLNNTLMARAFIEKGAKVYIGWNTLVLASHTDNAITHLLQNFLVEKLTLIEAVRQTFREVGPDPAYNSLLIYYPAEAGEQTIDNIAGNQTNHSNF
jgi:hypothetical protein